MRYESRTIKPFMTNYRVVLVAALTLVSWLGEVIHNALELPQLSLLSPENSLPGLVGLLLFFAWWRLPNKRLAAIALMAWAALHLVGGAILSVIPFSFLPFYPEQSLGHYAAHLVYGLAQLPLIG
jgi:hypothetical protein